MSGGFLSDASTAPLSRPNTGAFRWRGSSSAAGEVGNACVAHLRRAVAGGDQLATAATPSSVCSGQSSVCAEMLRVVSIARWQFSTEHGYVRTWLCRPRLACHRTTVLNLAERTVRSFAVHVNDENP